MVVTVFLLGLLSAREIVEPALAHASKPGIDLQQDCPEYLQYGDMGPCVSELQRALNREGADVGVDGEYGVNTQAAVERLQRRRGVEVDGVVGPDTKKVLAGASAEQASAGDPEPNPDAAQKVAAYASRIRKAKPVTGYSGEDPVPYSWGGGHDARPGPSLGTCYGYTGSIRPCPADTTVGVDCSGFTRWVFSLAYGRDVLGDGATWNQIAKLRKVSSPRPGDLVFYGEGPGVGQNHHVGIYMGDGVMINARKTGTDIQEDYVNVMNDLLGYYRLP